jgi:hypothetical protein
VAAMPSVGRIKQLSVLGVVTAAVLGFSAGSASADTDVWLWACHGPDGRGLPLNALEVAGHFQASAAYDGSITDVGDTCTQPSGGGKKAGLPAGAVHGASSALLQFDVPPGLQMAQVKIRRETTGLAGNTGGQSYAVTNTNNANPLEAPTGANVSGELDKTFTGNGAGDQLRIGVSCSASPSQSCPATSDPDGPVSVFVSRVGMRVSEIVPQDAKDTAPKFAIGGLTKPAAADAQGNITLDIRATDAGMGLRDAVAWFDDQTATPKSFGGTNCTELTPNDASIDLPLDADCPKVGNVSLTAKAGPSFLSNADHTLYVQVTDWAGHTTRVSEVVPVLNNPDLGTFTRTLSIGTSGITTNPNQNGANNGSGGVAGASATSCRSPRLSMVLSEKPLRVRKGVPVLKRNKRYKFNGRLTCVINGKRRSAPKRTRIDILSQIGKKTTEGPGTTTAGSGKISVILAYPKSRTLIFRFTNSDGQRSQVRIKITVAKK